MLANAITGQGRDLLLWSKDWFERAGFKVLYGDTDSLFVDSGSDDAVQARAHGLKLVLALNDELTRYVATRWNVASRLEIEFEKLYLKLFLPSSSLTTTTLLFECRSIPLNFISASFELKRFAP